MVTKENKRILLVDDDHGIHDSMRQILTQPPSDEDAEFLALQAAVFKKPATPDPSSVVAILPQYQIDCAHQGEEAFHMVKKAIQEKNPYAVIFMDMRMPPGWDGVKTIQEIWKIAPRTEVVVVSAYSDYSWKDFTAMFGVTDHLLILRKPFHAIELQQISMALTRKWNVSFQLEEHLKSLEEKALEQTNTIAIQQLKVIQSERLASLGTLASGISHEINNPLAIIVMAAENIKDVCLDPKELNRELITTKVNLVLGTAVRIGKIVEGLRSFSNDAKKDTLEIVDVHTLISDALMFFEQRFKNHGIALRYVQSSSPLTVECRSVQVSQVILNLLNNAYDALAKHQEKWIEIAIQDQGDSVTILITDSGPEISKDIVNKIFDPFFTTKDLNAGTGLGLSIARGLMTSQNGELTLDTSTVRTKFVVKLLKRQPL